MAGPAPQWEYCLLYMLGARLPPSRLIGAEDRQPGETHYHAHVVYIGPDGASIQRQLARFDDVLAYNPFYRAIGLLGGAGWELVSLDLDRGPMWTDEVQEIVPYRAGLSPSSRTAYFKRPVVPGRRVDEPELTP